MVDPKAEHMTPEGFLEFIGWFDSAGNFATHDPIANNLGPLSIPSMDDIAKCKCMICEQPFLKGPMRTISLMRKDQPKRSYFFRIHGACAVDGNDGFDKATRAIERFGMELSVSA